MNSQIKINSNEGGQFNASNNRVSFSIPEGNYYDLSKAYLNLVMSCDVTAQNETANGLGVYIPNIVMNDSGGGVENYGYQNSVLIRTVKMDCELRGNIEEIQRSDILTQNLNAYSYNTDQNESKLYTRLFQPYNISRNKGSLFTELHKEGQITSRNVSRQPIRILLSDLMNFCKTKQFNTGKYGKTTLELELNLDRLGTPTQVLAGGAANVDWVQTNVDASTNECGRLMNANAVGNNANQYIRPVSANLSTFVVAQDAVAGINNGIVPRVFNRLEDSPYHVGMKVVVTGTYVANGGNARGGAALSVTRRIVSIQYNRGNGNGAGNSGVTESGSISITLNSPINAAGNLTGTEIYHDLLVRGDTCTFGNGVVCEYAELVVEELNTANIQAEPESISYQTFKTEEVDCSSVQNYRHNFIAEPNAINLYITQPTDNTNRTILSRQNGVDNYRLRINNKDCSSRNIFLRDSGGNVRSNGVDPLHIVKQSNALVNSDRLLKDLSERTQDNSINTGSTTAKFNVNNMLIAQVLPITAMPKNIQVNIDCRTGQNLQNLCVFREVIQEI